MTDWKKIGAEFGAAIGEGIAKALPGSLADQIRADYAARYGKCRRCDAPLGGPSPQKICATCHPDELLEQALGGAGGEGGPPS